MRSPLTFPCDKDADRITVNIALPSGGIASLSQIPAFFKVDDILMALSTVQRKEVRLPKKLASRNQSPYGITVGSFFLLVIYLILSSSNSKLMRISMLQYLAESHFVAIK